ncbi:unnamed protein product [Cyprideis torosa]|uniref:Uncharacterized protein n=1 Tax=Cyprideis torosa TaxID=163714 RepID=A0A7R8WGG2_9CRUS|nr:unnamed protein product [Cyprideis torosa]CAG0896591.1 unnamed protein product [Cyprideis torosa]
MSRTGRLGVEQIVCNPPDLVEPDLGNDGLLPERPLSSAVATAFYNDSRVLEVQRMIDRLNSLGIIEDKNVGATPWGVFAGGGSAFSDDDDGVVVPDELHSQCTHKKDALTVKEQGRYNYEAETTVVGKAVPEASTTRHQTEPPSCAALSDHSRKPDCTDVGGDENGVEDLAFAQTTGEEYNVEDNFEESSHSDEDNSQLTSMKNTEMNAVLDHIKLRSPVGQVNQKDSREWKEGRPNIAESKPIQSFLRRTRSRLSISNRTVEPSPAAICYIPAPHVRQNMSFTNGELKRIDRENQILLGKILRAHNTPSRGIPRPLPPFIRPSTRRPNSKAINRKKLQRQIEFENLALSGSRTDWFCASVGIIWKSH